MPLNLEMKMVLSARVDFRAQAFSGVAGVRYNKAISFRERRLAAPLIELLGVYFHTRSEV